MFYLNIKFVFFLKNFNKSLQRINKSGFYIKKNIFILRRLLLNNFCLQFFLKNFYNLNKLNILFNYFFTFNCYFYNFLINNVHNFYKLLDTNNNYYYWFLIKFFKKKNKNKKKRKFSFLKAKRNKVNSKNLKKYLKTFKFKKIKLFKKNFLDLDFLFYYNYLIKINNKKSFFLKKLNYFFFKNYFIEINLLKPVKLQPLNLYNSAFNNFLFYKVNFFSTQFDLYFNFYSSIFNTKLTENSKFINTFYFNVPKTSFDLKLKKLFYLQDYSTYNPIKIGNFFLFVKKIYINLFFVFYKNVVDDLYLDFAKIQKNNFKKWSNKLYFYKISQLNSKDTNFKKNYIFYKKLNHKTTNNLLDINFYKAFFFKLTNHFNLNLVSSIFYNFNKYNFYYYFNLNKNIEEIILFLKKNDFFLKNKNWLYNNHTPLYLVNKSSFIKFQKIFKSFFNKKFNNYLYYYVIPFFELFLNKKIFIKNFNLNIFKKNKYKKILYFKKAKEIFFKNKFLTISKTVSFNLSEFIEIILYSFYRKDISLLMSWFIKNFKDIHFTQHKNFLVFFKIVINDVFESYKNIFLIKGFYFVLKGKISVTSNAKKKTVKFFLGSLLQSRKFQKVDFQQNVVKSLSGSLGISMLISY